MDSGLLIALVTTVGVAAMTAIGNIVILVVKHRQEKQDKHDELREAVNKLLAEADRNTAVAKGVECILHDRIKMLAKKYIEAGEIHADDLEALMEMHASYKALGGNGYLDALMEAVRQLPIVK